MMFYVMSTRVYDISLNLTFYCSSDGDGHMLYDQMSTCIFTIGVFHRQ